MGIIAKKIIKVGGLENVRLFLTDRVFHDWYRFVLSFPPQLVRQYLHRFSLSNGKMVLDPFCGTGGILLEAGLIGAHIFGSDLDEKMVEGCKKTLDYYGIYPYTVFQADVGEIGKIGKVDSVVSDFPYGRSTRINRKLEDLYARAFDAIRIVLKKDSQAVVGLPDREAVKIAEPYLRVLQVYPYRVHKSLTRYFTVFRV